MSNPNFIVIEGEESLCADYVNRVTRSVVGGGKSTLREG